MEDDDSEDVILVDSPLYSHLKELGYDEFEVAERCDSVPIEESISRPSLPEKTIQFQKSSNVLKRILQAVHKNISQGLYNLNQKRVRKIKEVVVESHLLEESDQALLEDLIAEFSYPDQERKRNKFFPLPSHSLAEISSVAVVILSLSCSLAFITCLETSVWKYLSFGLLLLLLLLHTCMKLIIKAWNSRCTNLTENISELLKSASSLHDLNKKGIRMIQEAELIARGFTLISVQATAQRLESSVLLPVRSPEKQCPELREAIFRFAKKCFFCYRDATYHLLKIFPLHKEIDMSSHYLACIKLQDLGPLFVNSDSSEARNSSEGQSDFFAVSSLKSLVQMVQLQQSEFFRRLVLSFLHGFESEKKSVTLSKVFQTNSEMTSILGVVRESVCNAISGLQKLQLYYKHLGMNKSEFDTTPRKEFSTQSRIANFQTAIHSLLLHLQASVIRVHDVENELATLEELSKEQVHSFEQKLLEIQSEFIASSTCLEESLHILSSSSQVSTPVESEELKVCRKEPEATKQPVKLLEIGEPVIEDQVFEAITTHVEGGADDDGTSGLWFTDEKEVKKKSKECSVNLLRELKSVLVSKAEEHRRREAIAKAKTEGVDIQEGSSDPMVPKQEVGEFDTTEAGDSAMLDSLEKSEQTVIDNTREGYAAGSRPIGKSDSDSTGSIEIINADSPLEEKLSDFLEAEHDSASTGSIEVCGDSPLVENAIDFQSVMGSSGFNFAAALAAQVAQRSRLLGLTQQTFSHEPEDSFGDSDVESPS